MRVIQLVAPFAEADLAADRLWLAGAGAVEEVRIDNATVGLRSVLAVDDEVSVGRLGVLPAGWTVEWIEVPDEPAQAWRAFAAPIDVAERVVLRPAWLPPIDDDRLEIAIEPGGSFGLGDHPTTRLCAAAAVRLTTPGCRVLDVGCGSGVLGIVAARLGAARVLGIDVAEAAIEATVDNARRNGVADLMSASATPISAVDDEFDLVLANLLAPTIVSLAADLRRVMTPEGVLVVSGILAEAHAHVLESLSPLRVVRTDVAEAWAAVELRG